MVDEGHKVLGASSIRPRDPEDHRHSPGSINLPSSFVKRVSSPETPVFIRPKPLAGESAATYTDIMR